MHIHLTWSCRVCAGVAFLCLLCAFLPALPLRSEFTNNTLQKQRWGTFFSLRCECHNRYNKLLLCNFLKMLILHDGIKVSKNGIFVLFSKKEQKPVSFKKDPKETDLKNGWVVSKNVFISTLIIFHTFFAIFPWSHDLEWVTSLSIWLVALRTPRVYVPGNKKAENYWYLNT